MSIGDNIKKWREYRNLKQSELAEMLGVSDKTVSSWEINRTEPKMGMVEKISSALHCKKTDIIGIDEVEASDEPYYLMMRLARLHRKHSRTQSCAPSSTLPGTFHRNV